MAIDIVTLGIEMDTSDLRKGKKDLDAVGDSANKTSKSVTSFASTSAKALGAFAASFAGAISAVNIAQKLIETERATGVLTSSLKTATGSAESAGLAFVAIQDLASKLPESVNSVADAFIKMRNLGLDPSQKAIESYSNTAAAMGKSLNQMVEAVADAATGEFERLKEFGIKAKQQGDEVAFTFQGVTTTVQKNSEAITGYLQNIGNVNFSGAAAERMKTLDGAISNFQDSWDGLFRTVNEKGVGDFITESVLSAANAIQSLSDSIASGQLGAYLNDFTSKFAVFSDAAITAFEIVKIGYQSMLGDLTAGGGIGEFFISAFRDMPENIAAFIQIVAVEIAVLVDKAKIYGEQIAFAMNPANWFSDAPDMSGAIDAINSARQETITEILKERDAALASYDEQISAADRLLEKHREQKSQVIDLGQFQVQQSQQAIESSNAAAQAIVEQKAAADDYIESLKVWVSEQNKIAETEAFDAEALIEGVNNLGGAWSRTGSIIVDTFGSIADALDDYQARQNAIAEQEKKNAEYKAKYINNPEQMKVYYAAETKLNNERVKSQLSGFKSIAGAASSMFSENSKARKAFHSIEMSLSAIELAMSIKNTSTEIALSMSRGTAAAVEGVANQSKGDPYSAFARMAAMAAIMAGLGFAVGGMGGGGGGTSAEEVQAEQGTGSVLGSNGKSESLQNSIEKYSEIGMDQLVELRGIREGLAKFNGGITQLAIGVSTSALADQKYLQFADTHLGVALESGQLETTGIRKQDFRTRERLAPFQSEMVDIFNYIGESVSEATKSLGLSAQESINSFYLQIGKVSFEGLSGEEIQQELSAIFSQQADLITGHLVPAMKEYQQMGEGLFETLTRVAQEQAIFNDYMRNMGLSMEGVSSIMAIDMAQSIAEMMGGFENFADKAATYIDKFFTDSEKFDMLQQSLSGTFAALGVSMPTTIEGFRDLVEGIDRTTTEGQRLFAALLEINPSFAEFAEQLADANNNVLQERIDLENQLKQLTQTENEKRAEQLASIDESNRAIQEQIYALQDQAAATRESEAAAKSAAAEMQAIANQRYSLETKLLQAEGNTEELRARELEKLDESNRALQLQIWALEDQKVAANEAAKAADEKAKADQEIYEQAQRSQEQALDDARRAADEQRKLAQGVHDSISDALKSLMGESDALAGITQSQARATLQSALSVAKAGGSLVGFGGLEDALGAVQRLDASKFSSGEDYRAAMGANIGLLSQLEKYTRFDGSHAGGLDYVPFDGYIAKLHKGERVQTANEAKSSDAILGEIRNLLSDINSGTIASNTKLLNMRQTLDKWDGDGLPQERVA